MPESSNAKAAFAAAPRSGLREQGWPTLDKSASPELLISKPGRARLPLVIRWSGLISPGPGTQPRSCLAWPSLRSGTDPKSGLLWFRPSGTDPRSGLARPGTDPKSGLPRFRPSGTDPRSGLPRPGTVPRSNLVRSWLSGTDPKSDARGMDPSLSEVGEKIDKLCIWLPAGVIVKVSDVLDSNSMVKAGGGGDKLTLPLVSNEEPKPGL